MPRQRTRDRVPSYYVPRSQEIADIASAVAAIPSTPPKVFHGSFADSGPWTFTPDTAGPVYDPAAASWRFWGLDNVGACIGTRPTILSDDGAGHVTFGPGASGTAGNPCIMIDLTSLTVLYGST